MSNSQQKRVAFVAPLPHIFLIRSLFAVLLLLPIVSLCADETPEDSPKISKATIDEIVRKLKGSEADIEAAKKRISESDDLKQAVLEKLSRQIANAKHPQRDCKSELDAMEKIDSQLYSLVLVLVVDSSSFNHLKTVKKLKESGAEATFAAPLLYRILKDHKATGRSSSQLSSSCVETLTEIAADRKETGEVFLQMSKSKTILRDSELTTCLVESMPKVSAISAKEGVGALIDVYREIDRSAGAFSSGRSDVRLSIIAALVKYGKDAQPALNLLKTETRDRNERIREAAENAISEIESEIKKSPK